MRVDIRTKTPKALESLGWEVFLEVPLYEAREKYQALYVNEALFKSYFNDDNTDFSHMASVVEMYFSTTIDPEKSNGKSMGMAYVDRQADPLKLSLNDNLGSGRAFYQYDVFNIKGEKTPLAQSEIDHYSNGVLELEKAIFETIASNSLYQDTAIQLSPILAVLDIDEPCTVYWKNKVCRRAKVIRVDMDGSLNRITHVFQTNRPLKRDGLLHLAIKMGEQDAEKVIHRIEHGAWSAGNISEHAHMIDFDTVCAARYRAPQFSFTRRYLDNYFGHEYLGQLKILKSLVLSKTVNVDNVKYSDLKRELLKARERHLVRGFTRLMGFDEVPSNYDGAVSKLVNSFLKLAARCYPDFDALELKFAESLFCSPFNFSRFFRYYPLLKRSGRWDTHLGLEYLLDCVREIPAFDLSCLTPETEEEQFLYDTVYQKLDAYLIHSDQELFDLSLACFKFIERYDALHSRILAESGELPLEVEARAYRLNEDRTHLFMPLSMAGPIDDERDILPTWQIHQVISATILANRRNTQELFAGMSLSNMEVFKEGYFASLHDRQGRHCLSLNFYEKQLAYKSTDTFEVEINGEVYPCELKQENRTVSIVGPLMDNLNLLEGEYKTIIFYKNSEFLTMHNFMFSFTNEAEVRDFSSYLQG